MWVCSGGYGRVLRGPSYLHKFVTTSAGGNSLGWAVKYPDCPYRHAAVVPRSLHSNLLFAHRNLLLLAHWEGSGYLLKLHWNVGPDQDA